MCVVLDDVDARRTGARRAFVVDQDLTGHRINSNCTYDTDAAAVGKVQLRLGAVCASRKLADTGPGGNLGAGDDLVGQCLDVVEVVTVAQRPQPLRPNFAGRHLGVEVTGHVIWLANVGEDELPYIGVALAGDHEPADGYPEALFEHVTAACANAVTAHIGVVDGGAEERNDPPVVKDGIEHGHVEQLTRGFVGIVGDQYVTLDEGVGGELVEHGRGGPR